MASINEEILTLAEKAGADMSQWNGGGTALALNFLAEAVTGRTDLDVATDIPGAIKIAGGAIISDIPGPSPDPEPEPTPVDPTAGTAYAILIQNSNDNGDDGTLIFTRSLNTPESVDAEAGIESIVDIYGTTYIGYIYTGFENITEGKPGWYEHRDLITKVEYSGATFTFGTNAIMDYWFAGTRVTNFGGPSFAKHFDTTNVVSATHLFAGATLNHVLDIHNLNFHNVRNMSYMFYDLINCSYLWGLDAFDISSLTVADYMFARSTYANDGTQPSHPYEYDHFHYLRMPNISNALSSSGGLTSCIGMFENQMQLHWLDFNRLVFGSETTMTHMLQGTSELTTLVFNTDFQSGLNGEVWEYSNPEQYIYINTSNLYQIQFTGTCTTGFAFYKDGVATNSWDDVLGGCYLPEVNFYITNGIDDITNTHPIIKDYFDNHTDYDISEHVHIEPIPEGTFILNDCDAENVETHGFNNFMEISIIPNGGGASLNSFPLFIKGEYSHRSNPTMGYDIIPPKFVDNLNTDMRMLSLIPNWNGTGYEYTCDFLGNEISGEEFVKQNLGKCLKLYALYE